jgi:Na+/H+-dicarboxylate symporter
MISFWKRFLPRSVAAWCMVAIGAGLLAGWAFGPACSALDPLGQLLIRSYSLVILPYLMLEVVGTLGGMSRESLILLLKRGGVALVGMVAIAGTAVVLLPMILPPLMSSPIFEPEAIALPVQESLLSTFLPANIFSALASGNVAGVLVVSIALGVLLQKLPGREAVLGVVLPLRALLTAALGVVAMRIAPVGIFAITAASFGTASGGELQRLLGYLAMMLVAVVTIGGVLLPGLVLCFTRFSIRQFWGVLRDPVVLAVTVGNVLLALPMVIENLRRLFEETREEGDGNEDFSVLEALAPISLLLFSTGRMVVLSFLPFVAWYHDTPMRTVEILQILPRVLLTSAAGTQAVLIHELPALGLPQGLLGLYLMNAQWIVRLSDPLSLFSLAVVSFVVLASLRGRLTVRPLRLVLLFLLTAAVGLSMGWGANRFLTSTLEESSDSRRIILSQGSIFQTPPAPVVFKAEVPETAPVSLEEIRRSGVLRAGVVDNSVPWVYRNNGGKLVGYDIDLLTALAARLGVVLEISTSDRRTLREWLEQGRIDIAAGGIHDTGIIAGMGIRAIPYESVALAFVVPDSEARQFQRVIAGAARPPLVIDYGGREYLSPELERSIRARLAARGVSTPLQFNRLEPGEGFPTGRFELEVLLTSAEAGSAFAVLHPETSMIPVFGDALAADVCLVVPARDVSLTEFIEDWVKDNRNLDLLENLRTHWILFKKTDSWPR